MKHDFSLPFKCVLFSAFCASAAASSPYGVCAHLHRVRDPAERAEECRQIAATGIDRVRFDFEWWRIQKGPGEPFDFAHYDACMADARAAGLTVLPIIFGNPVPKWADPVWEHLDEWGRYVEAVVKRYGSAFPDVEIWNEQNLKGFWHHEPDAGKYLEVLRTAYAAAKRANPSVRVFFGGVSGVPTEYIEQVYKLGGAKYFDAMNVHPYNHPHAPEGDLDIRLERLRALMVKYGDAEKPIVLTEHGWPSHRTRIFAHNVLRAGLKVACPERKSWRAVYAATMAGAEGLPPRDVAEAYEEAFPPGSTVEVCFGARLRERLAAGDVDVVIYPMDESFPVDTFPEVAAFVEAGGTLVAMGGMPLWFPIRETAPGVFSGRAGSSGRSSASCRRRLKIDVAAYWTDPALKFKNCPRAFPTPAARAAGFRGDPAGEQGADRFQTPKLLEDGDEFIPLLVVRDNNGADVAAASVMRFDGGKKGNVILSGLMGGGGRAGSAGEAGQARYLTRALAIAFASGIEQFYWYEFRSPERDPQYSEHHFGLTHRNFTPKPAWGAYRNFVLAHPKGSVHLPGPWHDTSRKIYYPQWTRPDGSKAGLIWAMEKTKKRTLRFDGDHVKFHDYTGRFFVPERPAPRTYVINVGEDPVYFEGGALECLPAP